MRTALWAVVVVLALAGCRAPGEDAVTLFAAAGTTSALTEIVDGYTGGDVQISLAASSTLARQIERGAPADVFISAIDRWMDYLDERGMLAEGSRTGLVGNRLALVAPVDGDVVARVDADLDLVSLLAGGRLSTGDPDHVPVGMYAREALESLKQWDGVEDRLAPAPTTLSALAMVERGECPLGIVYATDAHGSQKVKLVDLFPPSTHTPIVFSAAIVDGHDSPAARRLLEYLAGDEARKIFVKHGYEALH